MDLSTFERKIYSQNGEDGVTVQLINMIYPDPNNKYYVEFGVENGRECNTRILREQFQWTGLQMDGGYENPAINLRREYITKDNIVPLFRKYSVPTHINLLCIDIDFNDFYCLHAILENYSCDILICEYSAFHSPSVDAVVRYDERGRWDGSNYFGASLLAFENLARRYNYSLIYCDNNGVNAFFIHNDIIREKNLNFINFGDIQKIYRKGGYGPGPNGSHPPDRRNRTYITSEEAMQLYRA